MKIKVVCLWAGLLLSILCHAKSNTVCIYGGSSASVTAAYSAAKMGSRVILVCPDVTIGGMTTGGLGQTDIGNKQAVTGLSRQFYRRLGDHYGKLEQWLFEPHVAEEILLTYLDHPRIQVKQGWYLVSVQKEGTRIVSITCTDRKGAQITVGADQFIDCTYEGDLMAKAGVSYRVGREDNSEYGETYNGSQLRHLHQFVDGIDPFVKPGDPGSGLLWGISDWTLKPDGTGDDYVQAYNYRICLTDVPENQVPITRPERYDSTIFELLVRVFEADPKPVLSNYFIWSRMPNHKTDINNRGPFSTDMIGMNHAYPDASWDERDAILQAHKDYTLGLLYFYMTDPRVPAVLQNEVKRWGLPKDEYVRTGHWTHQIYVREARRMVGEYVATQADCVRKVRVSDGIGFAAYGMDSHNCERLVIEKDGKLMVKNEGDVEIGVGIPYPISYRSLTPKREECTNLLVPVCLSASHIAYGSIRMEPVFMEMGQASGLAAAMAGSQDVQTIDVARLQEKLEQDPYLDGKGPDVLLDEDSPQISGTENWTQVRGRGSYGFTHYTYTGQPADNHLCYKLPEQLSGKYAIYSFQQKAGCERTCFTVKIGKKTEQVWFDRKDLHVEGQTSGEWVPLGTYRLRKGVPGEITLTSDQPGLYADGILLIRK